MTATIDTPKLSAGTPGPQLAYYNFDKIYSYNAFWNFLCGARGLGKTYGAKEKALIAAIKKDEQFILLRRYKEELQRTRNSFFADIEMAFPDHDFRINGYEAQMSDSESRGDKKRPWKTIGFFVALSTAQSMKGVSFHKVKTIIFDEFIIEKGMTHYLPDEATVFTNFYSTVDRNKDKTKVFFLANSATITNPYFLAYDIKPPTDGSQWVKKVPMAKGGHYMVCHFADSAEFKKGVYASAFGQFIAGSEYAEYAVESVFPDNHDALVTAKTSNADYLYTLETKQGTFSVWIDWKENVYYIQEKLPKQQVHMTILPDKMEEGKALLHYNDKLIQKLRTAFKQSHVYFDTPRSRNAFIEIFKR